MTIQEIVDNAMAKIASDVTYGKPVDFKSIIFQAVQSGMADAYQRGIETGIKRSK